MLYPFTVYKGKPYMSLSACRLHKARKRDCKTLLRSGGATSHQPRAERSGALGISTQTYYAL